MSELDVSDLLLDPEIGGNAFQVIRRQQTVNGYGETVLTQTTLDAVGAVYPTGDNRLQRQADFSTQADTITVVTRFRLRGASKSGGDAYQPDIVLWNGNHYVVADINQYTNYGAGFIEAQCTATDFTVTAAA